MSAETDLNSELNSIEKQSQESAPHIGHVHTNGASQEDLALIQEELARLKSENQELHEQLRQEQVDHSYKELFMKLTEGFAKLELIEYQGKPDLVILFANPAFSQILTPNRQIKEGVLASEFSKNFKIQFFDLFQEMIEKQVKAELNIELYLEEIKKWLEVRFFELGNQQYGCFIVDVSEKKQLSTRLDRQLEILKRVSTLAQVGGFEYDVQSQSVTWSDELFTIFEIDDKKQPTLEEAIAFYPGESRVKIEEAFANCLAKGESYDLEIDILTAKGNRKRVRTFGKPVLFNRKVALVGGALLDVSQSYKIRDQLNLLNEELSRSNKELEDFAYIASHDLQEPVRIIYSFSDLLAQHLGEKLDEQSLTYLNFLKSGAFKIRQMIDDLLQYSRVATTDYRLELIDLNEVIKSVLELLQGRINTSGVEITYSHLPKLNFNRTIFERVLTNLIENAIKYNDKDEPTVIVDYKELENEHLFSVADNGPGIDSKYHDDIFVIFKRLKSDTKGSGLGLAIVKRIVNKFGGRIWLDSSLGEGSKFYFTLPK